ncbi:fasciclin-like arabinogalactan protein 11 [Vitis vinifera]|uniref:fasciclin-like arabinogalactan protein 11 n=1 Tax=Vitis vinifera TaxID=29760 RepID=UPI0005403081|nr:fasciclin-like arabinogalactan protein 11 [Vitis vinifera]|eukprot:XP_010653712.1 PREDICTED: fasciclin-like arabinogalactan protein 11 [Vitis vinifera]
MALIKVSIKTSAQSSSTGPIDIIAVLGKAGTLNSFIDQQKLALTQFHIVHSFFTVPQFQTVSNPLHTEAGENSAEFPLNVIGNGTQVNMTTGLVNTTVDSTVYSDGQLAVYEIPQVLLSQGILRTQAPAPAPLPQKPKKVTPLNSQAPSTSTTSAVDSSDGTALPNHATIVVSIGVAVLAALRLCL